MTDNNNNHNVQRNYLNPTAQENNSITQYVKYSNKLKRLNQERKDKLKPLRQQIKSNKELLVAYMEDVKATCVKVLLQDPKNSSHKIEKYLVLSTTTTAQPLNRESITHAVFSLSSTQLNETRLVVERKQKHASNVSEIIYKCILDNLKNTNRTSRSQLKLVDKVKNTDRVDDLVLPFDYLEMCQQWFELCNTVPNIQKVEKKKSEHIRQQLSQHEQDVAAFLCKHPEGTRSQKVTLTHRKKKSQPPTTPQQKTFYVRYKTSRKKKKISFKTFEPELKKSVSNIVESIIHPNEYTSSSSSRTPLYDDQQKICIDQTLKQKLAEELLKNYSVLESIHTELTQYVSLDRGYARKKKTHTHTEQPKNQHNYHHSSSSSHSLPPPSLDDDHKNTDDTNHSHDDSNEQSNNE